MARIVHLHVRGLGVVEAAALVDSFSRLVSAREWRQERPWLAWSGSRALFQQLVWSDAAGAAETAGSGWQIDPPRGPLVATGFLRIGRDETDALALLFVARTLSERFAVAVAYDDRANPIQKMRRLELTGGRLAHGGSLESVLVRRPLFKRLPGAVIEMYPPRALGAAFGTGEETDAERRAWSFLVHGMRGTAPDFLSAEAEAMRIYHGLRFLN